MKLVQCHYCNDIFNLRTQTKACYCGKTSGHYTDNSHAVVTGPHTAIAIGNGSFMNAVRNAPREESDWRYDGRLNEVSALFRQLNELVPTMFMGWARMPDGPTNSHSKVKGDR